MTTHEPSAGDPQPGMLSVDLGPWGVVAACGRRSRTVAPSQSPETRRRPLPFGGAFVGNGRATLETAGRGCLQGPLRPGDLPTSCTNHFPRLLPRAPTYVGQCCQQPTYAPDVAPHRLFTGRDGARDGWGSSSRVSPHMGGIVIGMFIIGGIMPIMRIHIIIMSIMFIPILLTSFSDPVAVSWLQREGSRRSMSRRGIGAGPMTGHRLNCRSRGGSSSLTPGGKRCGSAASSRRDCRRPGPPRANASAAR